MPKRALVAIAATALGARPAVQLQDARRPRPGRPTGRPAGRSPLRLGGEPTTQPNAGQTGGGAVATPRATGAPAGRHGNARTGRGALADGTVAGRWSNTRFGPVQVQVTISNGQGHRRRRPRAAVGSPALGGDQRLRGTDPAERGAPGPERPDRRRVRGHLHEHGLRAIAPGRPRPGPWLTRP